MVILLTIILSEIPIQRLIGTTAVLSQTQYNMQVTNSARCTHLMLKETLHAARTRIKLAGNWSLSSDPEVGLTWANQGLDTRRLANRDWWAKEKRPCFQVSEQYNELIANQKIEGSEQNVARKSDFQHAGARVKVMFKVTSCQVQSVSEKTLCQNKV